MRRSGGCIVRLEVTGHAGFARPGEDIVCAGVSALVQAAAHGVVRHAGAKATVHDEPDGAYVLEMLAPRNERAQAVLETALSGLRAIAAEYPRHLSVLVSTGRRGARAEHNRPRKGA
ncbi:MAG: ribosomal-processing cysteine protease Prp [Candidatus Eremiobacteraeota bacterium]|nr:ribosomal-processing cysteine protease Prp [Candidatus Eremiobacteraeota bacterium]